MSTSERAAPRTIGGAGGMERVGTMLSEAMTTLMLVLGHRCDLLTALAAEPAEASALARRAGADARITQEWLRAMHAAGLVFFEDGRYTLEPGIAMVLAAPGSPFDLSPGLDLFAALAEALPLVVLGLRSEDEDTDRPPGVPQERYPESLALGMEAMSGTWIHSLLPGSWIRSLDGLAQRLDRGGQVAEIGCGGGQALQALAAAFPAVRAAGFDLDRRNVERARRRMAAHGLADRVSVHAHDAAARLTGPYDLVLALNVLHDVAAPEQLLAAVRSALAPDGYLLIAESSSAPAPEQNTGPVASVLYATSTLYCVPVSLADGGPARGTLGLPAGELRDLCRDAGLGQLRQLSSGTPFVTAYAVPAR